MTTPTLLKEYIWLLNTIKQSHKITFSEIQKRWLSTDMSEGVALARSSFNRHKEAIQDIFGINIECDRKDNYKYYIENKDVLNEDTIQNWLLSTLSVNDIISDSIALHDRIILQQIPCNKYLQMVVDAMKSNVRVFVKYHRYGCDNVSEVEFEPYCIKLFNQRWYLLAHFHRDATNDKEERDYFGMYSFDRIEYMELTDSKFEIRPDFDAQQFFSECFGVVIGDGSQAQRIVLRAYGNQRHYLRDLPLHFTQKEIASNNDYADFEMYIRPTSDFCSRILGLSNQVKILEPQSFVDTIKQMLRNTLALYK
ncbi:MAG: WYL domain-containing protein [Bacteroidales bacterium]|jgi:hypothetical protein|nr:WYL domain-containing protein [Bacteroidales bacterium]